jgi:hypothetical protein
MAESHPGETTARRTKRPTRPSARAERPGAGAGAAAGTGPGVGAAEAEGPAEGAAPPPLCGVTFCPICTFVTAVGEVRPELVEHLVLATREVLLAARALIDARLEGMAAPSPKMERLTIG